MNFDFYNSYCMHVGILFNLFYIFVSGNIDHSILFQK